MQPDIDTRESGEPAAAAAREAASSGTAPVLDDRLTALVGQLEQQSVEVLSLDVFDTLLWRMAPEPVDVFPIVGARLRELGLWPAEEDLRLFSRVRQAAEWEARVLRRRTAGGTEVTLPEIYARMAMRAADPDELARIEVEVERGLLIPDLDVVALAAEAKRRGLRVILVSDTYFAEADLRSFLARPPAGSLQVDGVFASSAHRVGKATGLFHEVLRAIGTPADRVVHLGDNHDADIVAAGRAGLRTAHFPKRPRALERLFEREAEQLRALAPQNPHALVTTTPGAGDFGLAALRSKVLRLPQRAAQPDETRPFWEYGATVLGPVLTGFADWVHERGAALGAGTVFCLMREGAVLARMVDAAASAQGSSVRAEPLWLSRHVLARASIQTGSRTELEAFLGRVSQPTLGELLETLGLSPADVPSLAHRDGSRLGDGGLAAAALDLISSSADLRSRVVANARVTRDRVLRYLRSRLPADDERIVLVDLGWGGTTQAMLDAILHAEGEPLRTHGLYLVTQDVAADRMAGGAGMEGFLGSGGFPTPAVPNFMRSPELLEQACMPDHGSQIDLTEALEPVLADEGDHFRMQSVERRALQDGYFAYQRHWLRYYTAVPGGLRPLAHGGRALLLAVLMRATVAPTREEGMLFSSWLHDENFGSAAVDRIVGGRAGPAVRHLDPATLMELPMTQVYWPHAMAAVHDRHLAQATGLVASGALPWELFASELETGDVDLYVDIGWGFTELGSASVPARRNRSGLSYVRADLRADFIKRIRFDPTRAPAMIRLDWIALRCWPHDRPDAVIVRLESPEDLASLELHGCRALAPGLLHVRGNDPQVFIDVESRVGKVWKVEIEVGFAVLPLQSTQLRERYHEAKQRLGDLAKGSPYGAPLRVARRVQRRLR